MNFQMQLALFILICVLILAGRGLLRYSRKPVILKRDGKNGKRCELVEVSGSEAKLEKATKVVRSMLAAVRKGFFPKNYSACRWCEFRGTEHCSGS